MRRALPAAALALAVAAPAEAASIRVNGSCFRQHADVIRISGEEFDPDSPYRITANGTLVRRGRVGARGLISTSFTAPAAGRAGERALKIEVSDGLHSTSVNVRTTRFAASFAPTRGNPDTLRVRFSVLGFGAARTVYVHWVRPNGTVRRSAALGRTEGPCGRLTTRLRRLFPFGSIVPGNWRLQFDTRSAYSPRTVPRYPIIVPVVPPRRR
jgi:hypothetical protein